MKTNQDMVDQANEFKVMAQENIEGMKPWIYVTNFCAPFVASMFDRLHRSNYLAEVIDELSSPVQAYIGARTLDEVTPEDIFEHLDDIEIPFGFLIDRLQEKLESLREPLNQEVPHEDLVKLIRSLVSELSEYDQRSLFRQIESESL